MNTPDNTPDDQGLRTAMRRSLAESPAQGLDGLQAKALAQWRQHAQDTAAVALGTSAGWRPLPRVWFLGAAALVAIALLMQPVTFSDPAQDDLLQPDLLSLISLGEL
jgi:hypothetical protein